MMKTSFTKKMIIAFGVITLSMAGSTAHSQTTTQDLFTQDFNPIFRVPAVGQPGFFPNPFPRTPRFLPKRVSSQFLKSKIYSEALEEIMTKWQVLCVEETGDFSPYGIDHLEYNIECEGEEVSLRYRLRARYIESRRKVNSYAFVFSSGKVFYKFK